MEKVKRDLTLRVHLDEKRMRGFAYMDVAFTPSEAEHFEECEKCRRRTIELIWDAVDETVKERAS